MSKKLTGIKIIHVALAFIAIILTAISLLEAVNTDPDQSNVIVILLNLARIASLFFSSVYLELGYRKEAADFYKMTLIAMVITWILRNISNMSSIQNICGFISLFALISLSLVKDLGQRISMVLFGILSVSEIISAAVSLNSENRISTITTLLILGAYGIMLYGKYADKAARGTD